MSSLCKVYNSVLLHFQQSYITLLINNSRRALCWERYKMCVKETGERRERRIGRVRGFTFLSMTIHHIFILKTLINSFCGSAYVYTYLTQLRWALCLQHEALRNLEFWLNAESSIPVSGRKQIVHLRQTKDSYTCKATQLKKLYFLKKLFKHIYK